MASGDRRTRRTGSEPPAAVRVDPRGLRLQRVAPFVPSTTVTVAELADRLGLSRTEVRLFTGFLGLDRVPMAEGMTVLDMMLTAGETALDGVDPIRVRHVLHAHAMTHIAPPGHRWMTTLREKLHLAEASVFDLSHQHCNSGLFSVRVVEALLRTDTEG